MGSLTDILTHPDRKEAVVEGCVQVINAEVADKSGLSGLAIKAAYKAVQGIRPGFVRQVVVDLLPEFATALDALYQEALSGKHAIATYFESHANQAAEALLGITDDKAQRSKRGLVRKTYGKLRPTALKQVVVAVPRVGRLVERHAAIAQS